MQEILKISVYLGLLGEIDFKLNITLYFFFFYQNINLHMIAYMQYTYDSD